MDNKRFNETTDASKKSEPMTKKLGDKIERLGDKVSEAGAEKIGQKIHRAGDKLEHSEDNSPNRKN